MIKTRTQILIDFEKWQQNQVINYDCFNLGFDTTYFFHELIKLKTGNYHESYLTTGNNYLPEEYQDEFLKPMQIWDNSGSKIYFMTETEKENFFYSLFKLDLRKMPKNIQSFSMNGSYIHKGGVTAINNPAINKEFGFYYAKLINYVESHLNIKTPKLSEMILRSAFIEIISDSSTNKSKRFQTTNGLDYWIKCISERNLSSKNIKLINYSLLNNFLIYQYIQQAICSCVNPEIHLKQDKKNIQDINETLIWLSEIFKMIDPKSDIYDLEKKKIA